jgi:iron complex outermembrane receptor protein
MAMKEVSVPAARLRNLGTTGVSLAALALGLVATPALSQTRPDAAPEEEGTDQARTVASVPATAAPGDPATVVVTGSRIVRDGYQAPTPTTVLGIEQLQATAPANIADAVNSLPQLGGSTTPRTAGAGVGGGTGGANFLNLRSLGANRTLVLLNGNRVVGAATSGSVDINLLPSALVRRVDVVTGGASAAYGSDAVAGVVNFVLDTNYEGLKLNLMRGISGLGDAGQFNAELTFGTSFAGGRGHFLISGQYADTDAVNRADSRDWFQGYKIIGNPAFTTTNGQPGNFLLPGVSLARATDGGLIIAGPLRGTQFGPGGSILQPFIFGNVVSGLIMGGGTPNDVAGRFQLLPPLQRGSIFARASYEFADFLTAYVEASYGRSDTTTSSSTYVRQGDITVRNDNPYVPAGLNLTGITSFSLGRTNYELGIPQARNVREMRRGVVGLEGRVGAARWNAYYQYGESQILNQISSNAIVANFNRAVDAVRNPAVGGVAGVAVGAPVCRSTLTNPGDGCQPFNPFGFGSPSAASIQYINGIARQNIRIRQDVAAINGQIEPFSLWAGPVSLAAGLEYRRESYTADADPTSVTSGYWLGNYKPGAGEYDVKEVFAEVIVPLLRDIPLVSALDFNGAVRSTWYSTSGRVTTWKAGLTWDVFSDLRLRGTLSRDIRAPNLNDLFLGGQSNSIGIPDVLQTGAPNVFITQITGGNPTLVPEVADTTALGIVYRPSWFPGFSASVDYYKIDISGAIIAQTASQIVNQCYGFGVPAVPASCSAITLANPGTLLGAQVRVGGINVQTLNTSGFDIEVSYRRDLADIAAGLRGQLELRALGTNVRRFETTLAGVITDNTGTIGTAPKWRWYGSLGYRLGASRTNLSLRYVGEAVYNNFAPGTAQSIDQNHIDSVAYLNFAQSFDFGAMGVEGQFYFAVDNLLDTDPPIVGGQGGNNYASYGANATYHDTIGRSFRAGVRLQF